MLHDPNYCGKLTMQGLYDLMLEAGYEEEQAQEVATERGNKRLALGQMA